MEEYKNIVIEALPLMLSKGTKEKASIKIANHMNEMLRRAQNENDLTVFAKTLMECKNFAQQNNLNGLSRACLD